MKMGSEKLKIQNHIFQKINYIYKPLNNNFSLTFKDYNSKCLNNFPGKFSQ